jgi:uncharacterized membrane protein YoaK (UPF0700 family)
MFTDVGAALGHWLRRIEVDTRRLKLSLLLIASFAIGGIFGAFMFSALGYDALYLPAGAIAVTAVSYTIYAHRKKRTG